MPRGLQTLHTLSGHQEAVVSLTWSQDGRLLFSSASDITIRVWNAENGTEISKLHGHTDAATCLAYIDRPHKLVAGYNDGSVRIWDTTRKTNIGITGHKGYVSSVSVSRDGHRIVSGGQDGTVRLWDVLRNQPYTGLRFHEDSITEVLFFPDGRDIVSASLDKKIVIGSVDSTNANSTILTSARPFCSAISPNNRLLVAGCEDATILIWDLENTKLIHQLEGHLGAVTSVSFSYDGRILASKAENDGVKLWRTDTWQTILDFPASLETLVFHPSQPILATARLDNLSISLVKIDQDSLLSQPPSTKTVFYTTVKVALVGDSMVGKTHLGYRIAHSEFKPHPSTHGQQFWVVDALSEKSQSGTEYEVVLWDFAGQPDYRLVHALFLTDVDVALILFDASNRDDIFKGVEYWLKHLNDSPARKTVTILVGTKLDRSSPTITPEELDVFCRTKNIVGGYVGTSALTGEGVSELVDRLRKITPWDSFTTTVTTIVFRRIKSLVLELKENLERSNVVVTPSELRGILLSRSPGLRFSDLEMMTALRHLEKHGYVTLLRNTQGSDSVLLSPDLLVNIAASFIMEARRNPKGLGALLEEGVLRGDYRFEELSILTSHESETILKEATSLFIEHNICFRETLGNQTLLVFPDLINQKRPHLEQIKIVTDMTYHIEGSVQNVYASLVVLLGYTNLFTRTNQWQNQAQYEMGEEICGFQLIEEQEGKIELVLYYSENTEEHTKRLFEGLFERFLKAREVQVTKYPPLICPSCGYRQDRTRIIRRTHEGSESIRCDNCDLKIQLPGSSQLVTLRASEKETLHRELLRATQRTTFETAIVDVKALINTRKNYVPPSCFISYAWGDQEDERFVERLAKNLQNASIDVILDKWDNAKIGSSLARFIERISKASFVAVIGTPLYLEKYENRHHDRGTVVAAEFDLISNRLLGTEKQKATVLPLLVRGEASISLPSLLHGRIYATFKNEVQYFPTLFNLILTIHDIEFDQPLVREASEKLRR